LQDVIRNVYKDYLRITLLVVAFGDSWTRLIFHFKFSIMIKTTFYYLLAGLFVGIGLNSTAQVSISSSSAEPDPSAMMDVSSTDKGILIPRMTLLQRNAIETPAQGLLVFITDDMRFYAYNGSAWEKVLAGVDGGWNTSGDNLISTVSGNVGIGTQSPVSDIEVADAGNNIYESTEVRLSLYSNGSSAMPRLSLVRTHSPVLEDDTSAEAVTQDNDILGRISFSGVRINGEGGSSSGAGWIEMVQKGTPNSLGVPGQINFTTANGSGNRTTRMVINPNGMVGIGTVEPTNSLHVYSETAAALLLQGDDGWIGMEFRDQTATQTGAFGFMNAGNGINSLDITNRKSNGMISFFTDNGTTFSSKMVINGEGNVGIGTSSPSAKLDVEGTLDMNGNQIKNMVIENRTSDPSNPAVGQIWLRTDL